MIENKNNLSPALYLFPVPLSDTPLDCILPRYNIDIIKEVKYFIVENVRSARRFLKQCDREINIDELHFVELNRHTVAEAIPSMLDPLSHGHSIGVISDAGCPAIADPGADVVAVAQAKGFRVVPLVGPSSILLSLMGSGFNGQSFAFNGYLPIDKTARGAVLKTFQMRIVRERQTQIFIETPYRNNKLIADLAASLPGNFLLCVASDITGQNQSIITRRCSEWKRAKYDFDKIPTIFLLFS